MAEGKKSFILYADYQSLFNQLPDEIAGKLIKHLFSYVNDENPTSTDLLLNIAFEPIKNQLKRDLKEWSDKKLKRSEAGRLGGFKSGETRTKQNEAKGSNASKNEANEAVTVNDTVTVTVIKKKEEAKASTSSKVIIEILNEVLKKEKGKGFRVLDDNKAKNILKIYSAGEIWQAVINATQDKYHIETNFQYLTPEFFTRKDKVEKFLNFTPYVKRSSIDNLKDNAREAIRSQFEDLSEPDQAGAENYQSNDLPVY